MTLQTFTFNPFSTNGYLLASGGEAVLIDAPSHRADEHAAVVAAVTAAGLTVRHLILTHGHLDHVFGCAALADAFGLGWAMHRADEPFVRRAEDQARMFGVQLPAPVPTPTLWMHEGDVFTFGDARLVAREAPGHSPGSVVLVGEGAAAGVVVAGDVLFRGSIGRTDLPLGDLPTLLRSIETVLMTLPDATRVLSGHGGETTVGVERRTNPFLT